MSLVVGPLLCILKSEVCSCSLSVSRSLAMKEYSTILVRPSPLGALSRALPEELAGCLAAKAEALLPAASLAFLTTDFGLLVRWALAAGSPECAAAVEPSSPSVSLPPSTEALYS